MQVETGARRAVKSSEHCPKPHAQQLFPHFGRLHPLFEPPILFNTSIRIGIEGRTKNPAMILQQADSGCALEFVDHWLVSVSTLVCSHVLVIEMLQLTLTLSASNSE